VTTVVALIGAKALYLMYAWLLGCMIASTASALKGYSERAGLATAMLLSIVGAVVWMFFPSKRDSRWSRAVAPTDLVTVAGGFLLGGASFLQWFENDLGSGNTIHQDQIWIGLILLVAATFAVAHVLLAASESGPAWILERGRTVVMALGILATALILYRIASPPSDRDSVLVPAYVALVGAILVAVGPALARLRPFPRASQHGASAASSA
jgi:hypothetical protein